MHYPTQQEKQPQSRLARTLRFPHTSCQQPATSGGNAKAFACPRFRTHTIIFFKVIMSVLLIVAARQRAAVASCPFSPPTPPSEDRRFPKNAPCSTSGHGHHRSMTSTTRNYSLV
eukprot:scpid11205/ scgid24910/ 